MFVGLIFLSGFHKNWNVSINIVRNPQYKLSRTSAWWKLSSSIRTDRLTDRLEAAGSLVIYGEAAPNRGPHFPSTIRTTAFISISVNKQGLPHAWKYSTQMTQQLRILPTWRRV